jgi:threonine synthase
MWQFRKLLPVSSNQEIVSLGEGLTPVGKLSPIGQSFPEAEFKSEHQNPTSSFKDRSASLLITKAKSLGAKKVVIDSSGNAAASIAAYAAKAGIGCHAFVHTKTSPNKLHQIASYGANVSEIEGTRQDVLEAAVQFSDREGGFYCGFQLNPFATEAYKTIAYELNLQNGNKVPDYIICPMGTGGLLIGCAKGFEDILKLGWAVKRPKIVGVQPVGCSPIVNGFIRRGKVIPVEHPDTIAEGLKIGHPFKAELAIKKIKESKGIAISVSDEEILEASQYLAKKCGLFVEPSGAVSVAGLFRLIEGGRVSRRSKVLCLLTGSGLKHVAN